MIAVVPEGGLCNRMRVVASAVLLARAAGVGLRVRWQRTMDFNCRFAEIFAPLRSPGLVVELDAMNDRQKVLRRLEESVLVLRGWRPLIRERGAATIGDIETGARIATHKNLLIRGNTRLLKASGMYDCFAPAEQCAKEIREWTSVVENAVGVHIRRGDNKKSAVGSPLPAFVKLMREELERDPCLRFFVATDDREVMKTLEGEFGSRVFERRKRAYSRDDPVAIKDALVDLYALAGTRKIIGSYWSSFSETAAELSSIDLVVAAES